MSPLFQILLPSVVAIVVAVITQSVGLYIVHLTSKEKRDLSRTSSADAFLEQRSEELAKATTELYEIRQSLREARESAYQHTLNEDRLRQTVAMNDIKIAGLEKENKELKQKLKETIHGKDVTG